MKETLEKLAKLIRYYVIISTTEAGSGHLTSSLSAVELTATLFFGGFYNYDLKNPRNINNDRLIFSKGHASPLFYALFTAGGAIEEKELLTLRKFGSRLEGHPSMDFPFTEAPTGSLGQGLSIGVGIALSAKYLSKLPFKTYVLLGDSELTEGSIWEAIQIAAYYKLDNLIAILDINRLGQRGETIYGHNIKAYQEKISSFGWEVISIDGHDFSQIISAFKKAIKIKNKPVAILAKTLKGKGIKLVENKEGWHGMALKAEQAEQALKDIGEVDKKIRGKIAKPKFYKPKKTLLKPAKKINYKEDEQIATRKAYGNALLRLSPKYPNVIALDGEVSNSTYSEILKKEFPEKFFEMFITEQNMAGVGVGLASRGYIPFISTFGAFFTRAFDQIRMAQYAKTNVKFVGSHAGVSIGEDGPSQMALEDIAMFRTLLGSTVLYPSDGVSTEKLVEETIKHKGIVYIRTTRKDTPIIYKNSEEFKIGGSKTLKFSKEDKATVVAAGVTLFEALSAYEALKKMGIFIRVIDLYSIKPLDIKTLQKAAKETKNIITVEDHHLEGGLGEAVTSSLINQQAKIYNLAVKKIPRSGKPQELLDFEEISAKAIVKLVQKVIYPA